MTLGEHPSIVRLAIPPRPEYVGLVRSVVTLAAAIGSDLEEERIDDLRLVVSEACTNAIEAHAATGNPDPIEVQCAVGGGAVELTVRDRGSGFDPQAVTGPPPPGDPTRLHVERGLGIPLLRALADEVAFDSSWQGTAVRLRLRPGDLGA
jgi:serine/threonine-protein kinase RsbW